MCFDSGALSSVALRSKELANKRLKRTGEQPGHEGEKSDDEAHDRNT